MFSPVSERTWPGSPTAGSTAPTPRVSALRPAGAREDDAHPGGAPADAAHTRPAPPSSQPARARRRERAREDARPRAVGCGPARRRLRSGQRRTRAALLCAEPAASPRPGRAGPAAGRVAAGAAQRPPGTVQVGAGERGTGVGGRRAEQENSTAEPSEKDYGGKKHGALIRLADESFGGGSRAPLTPRKQSAVLWVAGREGASRVTSRAGESREAGCTRISR